MLSAAVVIAIVLGLWSLNRFFKKRALQARFAGGTRFDINDGLYGYVTDMHFVLIGSSLQQEIPRFGRDKLHRIELGSDGVKAERKSAEVVVLEWRQDDGTSKVFKLDIYEPDSKEKSKRLMEILRNNVMVTSSFPAGVESKDR